MTPFRACSNFLSWYGAFFVSVTQYWSAMYLVDSSLHQTGRVLFACDHLKSDYDHTDAQHHHRLVSPSHSVELQLYKHCDSTWVFTADWL